jgi:hypothetical protein
MKLIAHRGNFCGKDENENTQNKINQAISLGYDVEIDVWLNMGKLFLGHDNPQSSIEENYLLSHKENLWIHAKNLSVIPMLAKMGMHWFWHQTDDVTLTSKNIVWCYPEIMMNNSVINQPSETSLFWKLKLQNEIQPYGICHDDLSFVKKMLYVAV